MEHLRSTSTLIVTAPCRDGLIIAADTCATLSNAQRYAKHKLITPNRPPRTVLAVAGTGIVYPAAPAGTTEIIEFIRGAQPFLNLEVQARTSLENGPEELTADTFRDTVTACVAAATRVFQEHTELLTQLNNRDFFTLVTASFQPGTGASTIGSCRVRVEHGVLQVLDPEWFEFEQASRFETRFFGEADYVREKVIPHLGFKCIDLASRSVAEIPPETAENACVTLIQLASEIAVSDPPTSGIAPPIDVIFIGRSERPVCCRWASLGNS